MSLKKKTEDRLKKPNSKMATYLKYQMLGKASNKLTKS